MPWTAISTRSCCWATEKVVTWLPWPSSHSERLPGPSMRQEIRRWPLAGLGVSRTSWIEWPEGWSKSKRVAWWTERRMVRSIQQELAADVVGQGGDVAAYAAQELVEAHVEHLVDAGGAQAVVELAGHPVGLAARAVGLGEFAHAEIDHPQAVMHRARQVGA